MSDLFARFIKKSQKPAEIISFDTERVRADGYWIDFAVQVLPNVKTVVWYKSSVKGQIADAGLTNSEFADRIRWIADELNPGG